MNTDITHVLIPIILLSVCAGILFIENLHYLYVLYSIRGKLYLSTLLLGCAGFIFVTCEILVILFGIMGLKNLGNYFHLFQATTTAFFLLLLPMFLYYLLDLKICNKIVLITLMVIATIFLITLLFIIFFKLDLFLNFNKGVILHILGHGTLQEDILG